MDERRGLRSGRGWRFSWRALVANDPTKFLDDVFTRPSVPPLAGWLIATLIGIVTYLTMEFAKHGGVGADGAHQSSGAINPEVGLWTIGAVSVLALIAGWEPVFARRIGPRLDRLVAPVFTTRAPWIRWPRATVRGLLSVIWRAPSTLLSALDWLLARPVALLAGVRWAAWVGHGWSPWLRYATLAFWIGGSITTALFYLHSVPGLLALIPGFLAIFGVVRRWTWVERDREAFLIERGGPAHKRVGFEEDLRDEALTAMVFLFVLIPMALREIDQGVFDAFDLIVDGAPLNRPASLIEWIGFFGAELAKAVPFVDWSEVYNVENGSPIKPKDAQGVGPTLVFLLRATLDLLLIAAVLQAVQIAGRLREQGEAFHAGRLDILDPFAEVSALRAVERRISEEAVRRQSDIANDFPTHRSAYDFSRLIEIMAGKESSIEDVYSGSKIAPVLSPIERENWGVEVALSLIISKHLRDPRAQNLLAIVAASRAFSFARRNRCLAALSETNPEFANKVATLLLTEEDAKVRLLAAQTIYWLRSHHGFEDLSEPIPRTKARRQLRAEKESRDSEIDVKRRWIDLSSDEVLAACKHLTARIFSSPVRSLINDEIRRVDIDLQSHWRSRMETRLEALQALIGRQANRGSRLERLHVREALLPSLDAESVMTLVYAMRLTNLPSSEIADLGLLSSPAATHMALLAFEHRLHSLETWEK